MFSPKYSVFYFLTPLQDFSHPITHMQLFKNNWGGGSTEIWLQFYRLKQKQSSLVPVLETAMINSQREVLVCERWLFQDQKLSYIFPTSTLSNIKPLGQNKQIPKPTFLKLIVTNRLHYFFLKMALWFQIFFLYKCFDFCTTWKWQ